MNQNVKDKTKISRTREEKDTRDLWLDKDVIKQNTGTQNLQWFEGTAYVAITQQKCFLIQFPRKLKMQVGLRYEGGDRQKALGKTSALLNGPYRLHLPWR